MPVRGGPAYNAIAGLHVAPGALTDEWDSERKAHVELAAFAA